MTLSYKMKSLESKGYRGNTSLFFSFQPNTDIPIHQKYLEQCTVMYKTVVICLLGCLGCFSMEEYHKGKKKKASPKFKTCLNYNSGSKRYTLSDTIQLTHVNFSTVLQLIDLAPTTLLLRVHCLSREM